MKKRRLISTFMAATLLAGTLAACGSASGASVGTAKKDTSDASIADSATPAASADDKATESSSGYQTTFGSKHFDDVTIQVELWDRENSPAGSTITENRWTEYIQDKMKEVGINVEFVPVPRGDEVTWLRSAMAGGTAPDIVLTYTYSIAQEYFEQGGVWDLSEFIDGDDQALNMKKYLGQEVIDYGRLTGGDELCGIIARRATTARSNFYVRKDWMDELGLKEPTTPDELYDFVEKMVKDNPDGRNDVLGFSSWDDGYFLGAFSKLATDPTESLIACKLTRDYYDEGMKELYKFKNKLYNNGLMDMEYYARSGEDFTSFIVNGRYATFEDHVIASVDLSRGSRLQTLQENDPDADLVSIAPLKNIWDGKQYSTIYSPGGLIAFCPKSADAETVEACMTYLDWLCTEEGGFTIYHGFEDEHYTMEDGCPIVKDAAYNTTDKDWIAGDLFLTGNSGYFVDDETFSKSVSFKYPGYEDHVVADYKNALTGDYINDIDDSLYTSPSQAELSADINLVKEEWIVQLITCPEDEFEANFEAYKEALKDAGVETVEAERREHFTNS
ncbi:extracellular solute-binding protein [Butyrivibrio sp. MC2013]|uniref:extracellular solute-binding protein n=1 Tax=Butyrivibrio sp. MC2013 TaxID=1280686 RepID=UPI00042834A2|nr:extracellular solute-binding protein [Butyrivibrio sp. MC2013]